MKPQRFQPGQAVTPKNNAPYITGEFPLKFGKVYHVVKYVYFSRDRWWVTISEMPPEQVYDERDLSPVISDSHLESNLREITEPVPEECVLRYAP